MRRERRSPADDPGWAHFPDTVIELRRGGRVVQLDCRVVVSAATRVELTRLGLGGPFVVVTASCPGGVKRADAEDRREAAALARRLRGLGGRPVRADGGSPDRRHVEPGWATRGAASDVRRLAADAGQSAVFRFDGARLWIDPVLVDAAPIPLPVPPNVMS